MRDRFVLNVNDKLFAVLFDAVQKQLFEVHYNPPNMIYLSKSILGKYRDVYKLFCMTVDFMLLLVYRLQSDGVILIINFMVLLAPEYRVMV